MKKCIRQEATHIQNQTAKITNQEIMVDRRHMNPKSPEIPQK